MLFNLKWTQSMAIAPALKAEAIVAMHSFFKMPYFFSKSRISDNSS